MSKLVRLFPRPWRERYGVEFEALLEETPLTVRSLADVVGAAASARLRWVLGPIDDRLERLGRGVLGSAAVQRAGATAGMAGGLLWASTFAVGAAVDWGRYGRDLGFLLLIAAAGLLLVAQVTTAVTTPSPVRVIDWLGAGISSAGAIVLVVALIAAIILEPPLVLRIGLRPSEYWEVGMLAMVVGASVSALARAGGGRLHGVEASVVAGSAVALGLALLLTFDGPVLTADSRRFEGQHGWFVSNLTVTIAGILYGVGWLLVAMDRLGYGSRHGRQRGPRQGTGGG